MQLPLFETPSTWRAPTELPTIPAGEPIAIDTETRDPLITEGYYGFLTGDGHVAGVSVATRDKQWYFPFGHKIREGCLDRAVVIDWLREVCSDSSRSYIFHNQIYDRGWLASLGVYVKGKVYDVQVMASLIDQEAICTGGETSLDALGRFYCGRGKDEKVLRETALNWGVDPKGGLWKLPCKYIGAYAEQDARITFDIWMGQMKRIKEEGLDQVLNLECDVSDVLFEMVLQGVDVDLNYAQELHDRWAIEERNALHTLGCLESDLWTSTWIQHFCDKNGISYPHTAKGNPSFNKAFFEESRDPRLLPLQRARAINRTRTVYLRQNIIKGAYRGKIWPVYVQLSMDEGGTRSGRLACRNPNAQQFPKRSKLFDAKSIRKCLIPPSGMMWSKKDYWSQEPVLQAHYAKTLGMPGVDKVIESFKQGTKLYTFVEKETGGRCNYDQSKGVALGRSYGMGKDKMADTVHIPVDECGPVLDSFDEAVPYIKELADRCRDLAASRGWVRTILGRKAQFLLFVPQGTRKGSKDFDDTEIIGRTLADAKKRWPNKPLERAFTYKAFNRLIQGSAADQTKRALVEIRRALGRASIGQWHDEIGDAVWNEKEHKLTCEIMVNCVPLLAPVRVDDDLGKCWQ